MMSMPFMHVLMCVLPLLAQVPPSSDDVVRIGPGITPPRALRQPEPHYSPEARAQGVQGTVYLDLVVDQRGLPTDIRVISPLGFGLDEEAVATVATWRFTPGMRDGKPVRVYATVEVNFRFQGIPFDTKAERQRSAYNVAIRNLTRDPQDKKAIDRAVESMEKLAQEQFPPALYTLGKWKQDGDHIAKNSEEGFALIEKAAAKEYGAALYDVGVRKIEGRDVPKDVRSGLDDLRKGAVAGSAEAQFYLGAIYEKGDGVPPELNQSARYFRLCAAHGTGACQYRLGRLLLNQPDRKERDYIQAVAWYQLAAEQGVADAAEVASAETARLTPAQIKWVESLKPQLVHK